MGHWSKADAILVENLRKEKRLPEDGELPRGPRKPGARKQRRRVISRKVSADLRGSGK
jgi:hypothetical protein